MTNFFNHSLKIFFFLSSIHLSAGVLTVTSNLDTTSATSAVGLFTETSPGVGSGDLRGCLNYINSRIGGYSYDIQFSSAGSIFFGQMLPVVNLYGNNTININVTSPQAVTLNGSSVHPGLFVRQGDVEINGITFGDCYSVGGNGVNGGGGALGAGGCLLIVQM